MLEFESKSIGDRFKLPFGKTMVMNHYDYDLVYIEYFYGEGITTFTKVYDAIVAANKYGAVAPEFVKVIAVCGVEFTGRFSELEKIVLAIRKLTKNKVELRIPTTSEAFRLEGRIVYEDVIRPKVLDKDILWKFVKMWLAVKFTKTKYTIWPIEYRSDKKWSIVIDTDKK